MATSAFFTFLDRSREKSSMSFRCTALAADGSNYAAITTAMATLESALDNVTEGVIAEEAIIADRTRITNATPATGRRETKWLVRYEDAADKKVYVMEIPCADEDSMDYNSDSDFINMGGTHTERDALISALEAFVLAPNGQAINVLSIECVGRNT